MGKFLKSGLFIFSLILFIVHAVFADYNASGWPIFRKAKFAQIDSLSAGSPQKSDISGFLYNPAVLGVKTSEELMILSEMGPVGDSLGSVLYGSKLKRGMLGFGIVYYDAGEAELNWIDNGILRSDTVSTQRDIMAAASYGYKVNETLTLGISLKGARSELAEMESAYAAAGDIGVILNPLRKLKSFNVNFSLNNLGASTAFIENPDPLPSMANAGLGYTYEQDNYYMAFAGGVSHLIRESKTVLEGGVEAGNGVISLNLGYRFNADEMKLHAGMKFHLNNMPFGYAYIPGNYIGKTHRLSVGFKL